MKKVFRFFDKLEDKVRARLSRHPFIYSTLGGAAIILFWRGIWHFADSLEVKFGLTNTEGAVASFTLGGVILLMTGLYSSFFVGDAVLISGIKREKKLIEKTEEEVDKELHALKHVEGEVAREGIVISDIKKELKELKDLIKNISLTNKG